MSRLAAPMYSLILSIVHKFNKRSLAYPTAMRRGHFQFPPTVVLRPPAVTWSSTSETEQTWPAFMTVTVATFVTS